MLATMTWPDPEDERIWQREYAECLGPETDRAPARFDFSGNIRSNQTHGFWTRIADGTRIGGEASVRFIRLTLGDLRLPIGDGEPWSLAVFGRNVAACVGGTWTLVLPRDGSAHENLEAVEWAETLSPQELVP